MSVSELTYLGYGFGAGLLVALYALLVGWRRRRRVSEELERMRRHLHDQMEITQEGSKKLKDELEALRAQNENLRVSIKSWQQKPDRKELRALQVYDHALRELLASAPGFASYWENAVREAEATAEAMDRGLMASARRLLLPAARKRTTPADET